MQRLRKPPATIFVLAATAVLLGCGSETSIDATADGALSSPPGPSAGSTSPPFPSSATTTPGLATSARATTAPTVTTSTTQWTPPSITWPTTPYTLPADYGSGGPVCDPAPPRPTYPPGAALPTLEWTIDNSLIIRFDPPDEFRADPLPLPALSDCDRANGLHLLERWSVGEPAFAGLTVQANPGDDSPLLSRTEFSDSIVGSNVTWYLWNGETVHQTGKPPNMGLAVLGDYLLMIHGSPDAMRSIVENLTIDPTS